MSTSRGTNMLLMAAIGGVDNPQVYDTILEQGIDINYTYEQGANAVLLLSASKVEKITIIEYFLNKGVLTNCKDIDNNNLFIYAAKV